MSGESLLPDAEGYYIGYRGWRVVQRVFTNPNWKKSSSLSSLIPQQRWRPRVVQVASCPYLGSGYSYYHLRAKDMGILRNCMCGFYAYRSPYETQLERYTHQVFGAVALWGKVIVGTKGYRAQYAYPLWLAPKSMGSVGKVELLAKEFGIQFNFPEVYERSLTGRPKQSHPHIVNVGGIDYDLITGNPYKKYLEQKYPIGSLSRFAKLVRADVGHDPFPQGLQHTKSKEVIT